MTNDSFFCHFKKIAYICTIKSLGKRERVDTVPSFVFQKAIFNIE